jgi:hypothetical protein
MGNLNDFGFRGQIVRYYYNSKRTADESCDLSIFYLKRLGMLSGGVVYKPIIWSSSRTDNKTIIGVEVSITDDPHIRLIYSVTDRVGNKTDYDYEVSLVTTPCYFGSVRYWFACPLCWGRVGVLYLVPGDTRFFCRNCNNLSYRSRNRCRIESFGHVSRQIDALRLEIKCWTWRGRPTRKIRRLRALEWKMQVLGGSVWTGIEKMKARIRRQGL